MYFFITLFGILINCSIFEYNLKIKTMKEIKTTDDGWDCIPELKEYTDCYDDDLGHLVCELKNCKRATTLEDMIYELKHHTRELNDIIRNIENKYYDSKIIEIEE